MPLYEYKCPNGHITEKIRMMAQCNESITCHCGLESKRIFSGGISMHFGWKLSDDSLMNPNRRGADEYVRNI